MQAAPSWIFEIREALALKRLDQAVEILEREVAKGPKPSVTAASFRLHPWYDPLRGVPRFQALITKLDADPRFSPKARRTAASETQRAPELNAVAVLPFANLSGDPEQEYFSDGFPNSSLAHSSLAIAYAGLGRKEEAIASARTGMRLPELPVVDVGSTLGTDSGAGTVRADRGSSSAHATVCRQRALTTEQSVAFPALGRTAEGSALPRDCAGGGSMSAVRCWPKQPAAKR